MFFCRSSEEIKQNQEQKLNQQTIKFSVCTQFIENLTKRKPMPFERINESVIAYA